MASSWGSSWGTSWASSWGASDVVAAPVGGTMAGGGAYSRREVDRVFREYQKKRRAKEQADAIAAKSASIAALVEHNAQSPVLSDQPIRNDDEDAILAILLAA